MHRAHFFLLAALLLPFVPPVFTVSQVGCPLPNDCPCIRRPTFDSASLEASNPAVAEQFAAYDFSAPNVTYPNCTAIIATCPPEATVAIYNATAAVPLVIGGKRVTNPYALTSLRCTDGVWYSSGLSNPLDDNLRGSSLSCAVKINVTIA